MSIVGARAMGRRTVVGVVAVVALAALSACGGSSGTTNQAITSTVPEATIAQPPNSLPPGVGQFCFNSAYSVVKKIVGPFHGAVPESEYAGTAFAALLSSSLNNCRSRAEWLDATSQAASGYRPQLARVFELACASQRATLSGGTGGGTGLYGAIPISCRTAPTTAPTVAPTTVP